MLRQNVNEWLQIISPGNTFEAAPDEEHGQAFSKYNHFMPTESGFGLSYILPIITALLAPGNDHNLITIIENPEAHLHPKGQSEIGKLIAMAAAADKQVIVETHSDHIIDGIRIACRKKLINNEDIVFHYITKEGPEKAAEVDSVQPMPDGKLDHWPKGFFDQSLLDKAELLKK
jgi:predicted ATPase